jgi:hypothetical protein
MSLAIQYGETRLYEPTETAAALLGDWIDVGRDGSGPMVGVLEMFVAPCSWRPSARCSPDHLLRVAVNAVKGYVALVWAPLGHASVLTSFRRAFGCRAPAITLDVESQIPTRYQGNPFHSRLSALVISDLMTVVSNFVTLDRARARRVCRGFQARWTAKGSEPALHLPRRL